MDYVCIVVAAFVAAHTASYGSWLKKRGNRAGALFVWCLALVCMGLPLYRLVVWR